MQIWWSKRCSPKEGQRLRKKGYVEHNLPLCVFWSQIITGVAFIQIQSMIIPIFINKMRQKSQKAMKAYCAPFAG